MRNDQHAIHGTSYRYQLVSVEGAHRIFQVVTSDDVRIGRVSEAFSKWLDDYPIRAYHDGGGDAMRLVYAGDDYILALHAVVTAEEDH